MNIKKIFGGAEAVTSQERQKLEALDASCKELREWSERIPKKMPVSREDRNDRLRRASEEFAKKPSEGNFQKVLEASWHPADRALDDFETVGGAIGREIVERMAPQTEIIQTVLKRHLANLERQYDTTTAKEQKESQEFGIDFRPSGIIRGLEAKIMELRNRIAKGEHGHWREALAELL